MCSQKGLCKVGVSLLKPRIALVRKYNEEIALLLISSKKSLELLARSSKSKGSINSPTLWLDSISQHLHPDIPNYLPYPR